MKIVIVGGVAGGASAAARARRLSEDAEIVVFERGGYFSFANCGLPYYLGGVIADRNKLFVVSAELLKSRFRLDVRPQTEVLAINRQSRTVRARELSTGREYDEHFDKLILATGATPWKPPISGVNLPGVFTLRSMEDTDRIKQALDAGVQRAVVIGGGFIGLEMVENLVQRSIHTTLIELAPQVLPPLDPEMTTPITRELTKHGVEVLRSDSVDSIDKRDSGLELRLKSGEVRTAEIVIVGVGVRPENQLAVAAGLEVGPRGGVKVNAFQQTSDPDIYAVGDMVEVRDYVTGQAAQIPLAGPANRQGRIAASHLFGIPLPYRGTQGTAIVRVFGTTAAITGASEKTLRAAGRAYRKVYVHPLHHAGYFPGAEMMTLKLLFDPDGGRILGAQAVGGDGVDKRIDVLAVAIQAGMTVFDLEEVELAYAPQFGSAKDPVNMAGFVAAGLLRGEHPQIDVDALIEPSGEPTPLVLDVRTQGEYDQGHVPAARHIPVDELRQRLAELPKDRPIVAYCRVGQRGYLATRILRQAGYDAVNLSGGYLAYRLFRPEE
jgi:NADPH-dependent 2,4-dienoyl-CoA reductase/sulfur reductase-like enzyme/rhodanese-related sulfurtransferase